MQKARTPRIVCAVVVFLLALSPVPRSRAQVAGGTLSGTVRDQSGASIPNAEITVRDVATGITRTITTDTAGFYSVPNLLPGTYDVTTTAAGFSKMVQSGVKLTVGAQEVLNIGLQVGQVSQTVEVTSQALDVQLVSATISAQVDATTVRELPLNGRSWTDLATLQPGIVSMSATQPSISGTTSSTARGIRGFGNQLTISGARSGQNNYRLDGISENDYSNSSPGSVLGGAAGVDAIAEFSVLTSNYSAEYGRTSGGVVNAITRSGTNQFHGDVYEFHRNSALDARNFFDGPKIPPFRRNQFGASAGAPIWKDHTFVFGNYEGQRQSLGQTFVNNVPSADARNGILNFASASQFPSGGSGAPPCVGNGVSGTINNQPYVQCVVPVHANIKPFLDLYRLPNAGLTGLGNVGIYSFAGQQVTSENFVTTRLDHKFSDKDSIYGSFQWDSATAAVPDTLNDIMIGQKTGHKFVSIEESHVFTPELINTLRVGFNRSTALAGGGLSAINPAAADPALSAVPGWDAPLIQPTGITFFGGGLSNTNLAKFAWNSYQVYDDAFFTKGNHSIKFGFVVERMQDNYIQFSRVGGLVGFGSLANFLTDVASKFQVSLPEGVQPRGLRQTLFGGYVQDDVRLRPNLTINLGLRYEATTAPSEVKGQLGRLVNPTDATIKTGNPFFANSTLRNFEPRIGFAWDPFSNGKTSIRGGFGIFDVLPLAYEYSNFANNSAPFAPQGNVNNLAAGAFPAQALAAAILPGALRVSYVEPNPKRNYVEQWNFSVQRQLAPNFTATVAYVGSHGVHMEFRADDMNAVTPTLTPAGHLYSIPIGKGAKLNSNFGRIDNTNWGQDSSYHALNLLLQKNMSHGIQVQGSYTWGKSMDAGSGAYLSDPFSNSIPNLFSFDKALRRSVSDYNIAQNLTINYTWIIPTPKSLPSAAQFALGGWQLGGIISLRTGLPFTPTIGGDPLGVRTDDFDYPDRSKASGCETAVNPGNPTNYIKTSCFTLPVETPAIAAQCQTFGFVPHDSTKTPDPFKPGIAGTCANLIGNSGRNSIIGPGLFNFDFSMFKNNYIKRISESFNVQFRAEMFNILNRANFNSPTSNSALFDLSGGPVSGAGRFDSTSTTAREIQFGVKVIW